MANSDDDQASDNAPGQDAPDQNIPGGFNFLNDLRLAFLLLTRIPVVSRGQMLMGQAARAAWAFPIVGVVVGAAGGLVFLGANHLGIGLAGATLLAISVQVLITGALHEDGLADTADGFGGGRDREQKLAIMRDSRIGTYGVVALMLAFGLRFSAINELANSLISTSDEYDQTVSNTSAVAVTLIAAGALSRVAMAAVWYLLPPARSDGLALSCGKIPLASVIAAGLVSSLVTFGLLDGESWGVTIAAVAVAAFFMYALAKRQIGGHTGDVLGATQQIAEIAALLAISAVTVAI
jgi:adenosylcobinamide-GDP ribazoletransferase